MTMRSALFYLSAAAISALAVAAPGSAQTADSRPNLTVGVADLPPTLEPGKELSNAGTRITYSMFDTLIRRDFLSAPGGSGAVLVPGLAESWTRAGENVLEVKLRKGVKFHNGDELTAEDVVFTFSPDRLTGPKAALPEGRAYFGILEKVEAVDPLTVRFITKGPDPLLEQRLSSWASWIVNKKDWEAKATKGQVRDPIGTGPFKLIEHRPDQQIRLAAFDDYFGGKPNAAAVSFRKVPEPAGRLAGLVSGEFDIITNIDPDQVAEIKRYNNVEPRTIVLANSHVLVYNTGHPVLKDKRVRQALNLAIDRDLLVQALWDGKAVVPKGHQYPEYGPMFDAGRKGLVYDPARAKALLKEAGYKGEPIVYRTQGNYYTNGLPAAQAIQEMWRAAGINATLEVTEKLNSLGMDEMMVRNWSNSTRYPDPVGAIWIAWGPDSLTQRVWKIWSNPPSRFNEVGQALVTTTDLPKRQALGKELLDIWEDEAPGTILYQPSETYGVRKGVKWQPYTFYYMDLRSYNLSFDKR